VTNAGLHTAKDAAVAQRLRAIDLQYSFEQIFEFFENSCCTRANN
jgi:hypothetical protein